jgi:hypothetical protein
MLPPVGNCRGCRLRQRELARLRDQLDQLENDNHRLQRRLAKLKVDQDRLRQELDEARRQPHRQAGHFRRSQLKRRKKKWISVKSADSLFLSARIDPTPAGENGRSLSCRRPATRCSVSHD